ncbi:MAG: amino acid ABC transporter ATP-binding protein [Thermoproteales archaeon]|nr:amino acid ABC transporter ATP-binding protein [Thermoproteales archaeon]
MSKVLIVKNLRAGYRGQEVIKDISFSVEKGEKVVIMGPSGSGKSTLLKCLVRLIEPWGGTIIIDGTNVMNHNVDIRKIRMKTGFVFQSYNLFPHMTVLRNITLPLRVVKKYSNKKAEEIAMSVLKIVGMEEYANRYPLQLSGGQQQRVSIARALAMEPVILFLDEPTSALDPELREEVLQTLRKIARRGKSMLVVTHELDFAEDVADHIILVDQGIIIEEGPPNEILYNPKNERTKRFLKSIMRRMKNSNS